MSDHLSNESLMDPSASQEVHLKACGACSARRDEQRVIQSALRALPREDKVPPAALALLAAKRRAPHSRRRAITLAVVATITAAVVAVVALLRNRGPMSGALADELALDHLHYEHQLDAAQVRGDGAAISSFFQEKLGFAPHYGPIEAASFDGAKSCRIAGKWTALAWLDRAGHRLSLFTMPEHRVRARGCTTAEGLRVCGAPDPRGGARVLVGDLSESEMLRLMDESLE